MNDTVERLAAALREVASSQLSALRADPRRAAVAFASVSVVALILVASFTISRAFSVSCPVDAPCVSIEDLRDGAPLPQALRIYDRHERLLAEVAGPRRRVLASEDIPDLLADAFVAVEDRRFWEHEGVDARGVLRAAIRNVREGGIEEGASTIPMQLVRTLWSESLREVGPWRRKIIEARTAPRLVEELGHERVLDLYLNGIYLGNGLYGVERASRHYFGVGAGELDIGQIATLVGMTRSPEYYEPRKHPDRARAVRDVALRSMADAGLIDQVDAEAAKATGLGVVPLDSVRLPVEDRSHLTAAVTRELRRLAPELSALQGLELHTTVDVRVQAQAEEALQRQLGAIEEGRYGTLQAPEDTTARLEGAVVVLDARSAAVLGWVGGRDFSRSEFDRVDQARRQVGSLVKPFLTALALEDGVGIIDMVSADTVPIPTDDGSWLPADHVLETRLPLREALVRSSNRAAAHLGMRIGLEQLTAVGDRAGLGGGIPSLPASSIGAFDASLLAMTSAYASFGNGGRRADPWLLARVEDGRETVLWERPDTLDAVSVMDRAVAFVVLDAMRAVVDRGTGRSVRAFGYRGPAAGKTGTTNDGRDAWFVGLTPEMVAGVWIGFDTPRPIVDDRGGGALAAPVWAMLMRDLRGVVPQRRAWIPPPGVERVRYDPVEGDVVGPHCRVALGRAYHEAWTLAGRYDRRGCPVDGFRGFLDRIWRAFTPDEPRPPRPLPRRRPGGP
ncbi:MAG: transglycosylase domain-containing protein [Longimicrobiales bacterium]|nr:transglycosylase domain-containing protein [Longimicrobiales bacterium]